jgi:hypothetical protein
MHTTYTEEDRRQWDRELTEMGFDKAPDGVKYRHAEMGCIMRAGVYPSGAGVWCLFSPRGSPPGEHVATLVESTPVEASKVLKLLTDLRQGK